MSIESSVTNIDDYRIEDLWPSSPLEEIAPVAARARSLMVRNRDSSVLAREFLAIHGAVEMMSGLDYHHDRFMEGIGILRSSEDYSQRFNQAEADLAAC